MLQKKRRTAPFGLSSPLSGSPTTNGGNDTGAPSPTTSLSSLKTISSKPSLDRLLAKTKSKGLQKAVRPSSLFGSLRSLQSLPDEDDNQLTRTTSTPTSANFEKLNDLTGSEVLHYGEVQTAGNMFRKKSQYFVLTETHLVRFKSQARAAEVFPCIPASIGRSAGVRHSTMSSSGSLQDLQTSASSGEGYLATLLNQIVAVYKLDDGRPFFSVQISWLDEATMFASETTLQLHDPSESELWLSSIRGAAMKARLTNPLPFSQPLVEWTARALEQERDYDPQQFHMFKVVQRASKAGGRSSSDDLSKLTSNIAILAIGIFKVHLVPLPKLSRTSSNTSLSDMAGSSHGVTTLTALTIQTTDDAFSLTFRSPLRPPTILTLASFCSTDIALWLRQAAEYLRPEWIEQPFTWNVPQSLEDETLPVPTSSNNDYSCLDRTLCAYCAGYGLDASKIRYEVIWQCEDAPMFELQLPADGRQMYSTLELLAVMRALRYNESFGCISFSNISLDSLRDRHDRHGEDHVAWTTRSGEALNVGDQSTFTLLVQEIQALATKSKRLRRLDFSFSLSKKQVRDLGTHVQDPGCGICEALFPLCAKEYTNVDWIVLNGIDLKDADLDYLYAATIDRRCHFRAIEIAYCGLSERAVDLVLHALSHQSSTIESIDISGNPARLETSWHRHIGSFEFMRKLQLSDVTRTSVPEPLIPPDLLINWKLEYIMLDRTSLNMETVEALASYLSHPQSQYLKVLSLNQCQLTGNQAADLLSAQHKGWNGIRNLHIQMTENRLEQGHEHLVKAISRNWTPTQMTMKMLEYRFEPNFRALLAAFASNQATRWLDISKVTLPSDASEDTCEALRGLFAFNETIEFLDISGETTHIEAASLGRGVYAALDGLKTNKTLKILRIQHQSLGLQGANTIASVLEVNGSLQELYCEDNEINLQGFTIMVNSMEHNTSIQYLPSMDADRLWAQKKVDREVQDFKEHSTPSPTNMASTKATVRKTLGRTISSQKTPRIPERTSLLPEVSIRTAAGSVWQNWDREVARLQKYLERNFALTHGLPLSGNAMLDIEQPATGDSLLTAMNDMLLEKTPTQESNVQLGHGSDELGEEDALHDSPGDDGDDGEGPLEISQSHQV